MTRDRSEKVVTTLEGSDTKTQSFKTDHAISELHYAGLPALADIVKIADERPFVSPVLCALQSEHLTLLSEKFIVEYQMVGRREGGDSNSSHEEVACPKLGVVRIEIGPDQVDFLARIQSDMFSKSAACPDAAGMRINDLAIRDYIRNCSHRFLYKIGDNIVAALFLTHSFKHPQLLEEFFHIGFIGIEASIIDSGTRKLLRRIMREEIFKMSFGQRIAGKVSAMNTPSLRNAEKMGRSPRLIIVTKKP